MNRKVLNMNCKFLYGLALTIILVAAIGLAMPVNAQRNVTVYFVSYPARGTLALVPVDPYLNPIVWLSNDVPGLSPNATIPVGDYTVIYYPIGTIDGFVIVQLTQGSTITSITPYDSTYNQVSFTVTIGGDVTIVIFAQ